MRLVSFSIIFQMSSSNCPLPPSRLASVLVTFPSGEYECQWTGLNFTKIPIVRSSTRTTFDQYDQQQKNRLTSDPLVFVHVTCFRIRYHCLISVGQGRILNVKEMKVKHQPKSISVKQIHSALSVFDAELAYANEPEIAISEDASCYHALSIV